MSNDAIWAMYVGMWCGVLGFVLGMGVAGLTSLGARRIGKAARALGRGIAWPVRLIRQRAAGSRVWSHRDWEASPGRSAVEYDREGK